MAGRITERTRGRRPRWSK